MIKPEVRKYLAKLRTCREIRDEVCLAFPEAINRLMGVMAAQEKDLHNAIRTFKTAAQTRPKSAKRYGVTWKYVGSKSGPLPVYFTIRWYEIATDGGPPKRSRRPTKKQLGRAYQDETLTDLIAARDLISATEKKLQPLQRTYRSINNAVGTNVYFQGVIGGITAHINAWIPDRLREIYEKRIVSIEVIRAEISSRLDRMHALEEELAELMCEFNSQGDRWTNHLTATWRIPTSKSNVTGGSGPHFYKLKNPRGRRMLVRVRGSVTRDLIRECGQKRYEVKLLFLYKQMMKRSAERNHLNHGFTSMHRILQRHMRSKNEK